MNEIFNQFSTLQSEKERISAELNTLFNEVERQLSKTYFYYPKEDVFCKFEPKSQNILACGELDYNVYFPMYGGFRLDKPCFGVFGHKFKLTDIPRDLLFVTKDEFHRQIDIRLEKLIKEGENNE